MKQLILPETLLQVRKHASLRFMFSLLAVMMMSLSIGWGQTTIFEVSGGGALPADWVSINNVTTNNIDMTSYYLLDPGSPSDYIITKNLNLSSYSSLVLNVRVATYGSGTAAPMKIEISIDGGSTWSSNSYLTATPSSSTYIDGGPITISESFSTTTKLRFSNNRASGRGVRVQNLILTGTTSGSAAPNLTPDNSDNTVDNNIDITFTDDATWRNAITSVKIGTTALASNTDYTISSGILQLKPSGGNVLLTTSGTKSVIVSATGYADATVNQVIIAGTPTQLGISTQPTAPASNGGNLATQPIVRIQDQYGNTTTSTANVTAAVGAGSWTLGGTATVAASSGTATFSGLSASSLASVTGATISFSSSGLTGATSNTFNISAPVITLTAATGATVDNPFDVTFTDNSVWRAAITSITVGGQTLASAAYAISEGKITFDPSQSTLLQTSGSKSIVVIATGYSNASVTQTMNVGVPSKLSIITQPTAPASNGGNLANQPVVRIQDQYGNTTTSTADVTATVGAGSWTLGGTTTRAAIGGTATFSGLTASSSDAVNGATITFTSGSLTSATSNPFNIPVLVAAPSAPTNLTFGSVTGNSFTASFTAPGTAPTGYLVLRRTGAAVTGSPVAGTVYTVGQTDINSGLNEVVYVGTSVWSAFEQASLIDNTTYHYAVYAYNGSGIQTNYSSALTGSRTTSNIGAPVASTSSSISKTGFTANWGSVNGASEYKMDAYSLSNAYATDLFISEYIEGSSNNKYIEIFNGTGVTVDLSNYKLQLFANGASSPGNDNTLSGNLAHGATIVYKNSGATLTLPVGVSASDNTATNFNGDDAIALFKISTESFVDIIGRIGNDPGSAWTGDGGFSTADKTLVRKPNVKSGITTSPTGTGVSAFTTLTTEWDVFSIDIVSNLGSHTFNGTTESPISGYNNLSVSGTSQNVTGLTPNTTYYYRVRATGVNSTSANSNVISVTTLGTEATDLFRSAASGDWGSNATWQSKDSNVDWFAATATPTASAASVSIENGNEVTVAASAASSTLTLKPTSRLKINSNQTLAVTGNLTLQSSDAGTATLVDEGTLTVTSGTTTVQQYLTSKSGGATTDNWWYLSSPVSGATSASILVDGSNNKFGYYNEPTANYPQITATNVTLDSGKGYLAQINTTGTYEFTGTLNTGNVGPITLTRTPAAGGPRGFNLVGNPYPSHIHWNSITGFGSQSARSDIRPTIWLRTRTASGTMDFDTFDGEDAVTKGKSGAMNGYIAPMQAFWVKVHADDTSPAITFTNAHRSAQNQNSADNRLRAPQQSNRQILRLEVSNGLNFDQTVISTNVNAQNGYDFYDSDKMSASNTAIPEIYSLVAGRELVIDKRIAIEPGASAIVGFRPGQAGSFSIKATELTNLDNVKVILKDNQLNTETELLANESYTFTSDATATTNRFSIEFRAPGATTSLHEVNAKNTLVYVNEANQIEVQSVALSTADRISVFNLAGQQLVSQAASGQVTVINEPFGAGVYLVKVNGHLQKVIVK